MSFISKTYVYLIFFFLGLFCLWLSQQQTSLSKIEERIEKNIANVLEKAEDSFHSDKSNLSNSDFGIATFQFRNDTLLYWSNNQIPLTATQAVASKDWQLVRAKGVVFLVKSEKIDSITLESKTVELNRTYPVRNKFLKAYWNEFIFPERTYTILDAASNLGAAIDYKQVNLFKVSTQDLSLPERNLFINVGFVFLLLGLTGVIVIVYYKQKRKFSLKHIWFSILILVILRFIIFILFSNIDLSRHFLFSPEFFASSTINPTLGDLIVNLFFVFYITLVFLLLDNNLFKPGKSYVYNGKEFFYGWFFSTLLFIAFYFPVALVQTITHNSSEHFSISSSIDFTKIRIVFIATWFFSLFMLWLWFVKIWKILKAFTIHKQRLLLAGATSFSLLNYFNGEVYLSIVIPVWIFLFIVSWKEFNFDLKTLDFKQFVFQFLFLITVCISTSYSIQNLEREKLLRDLENYAEAVQYDKNVFTEYLIKNLSIDIQDDVFIQTRMNSPLLSKQVVVSKIKQNYLSGYLNRYQKEIHLFSTDGKALTKEGNLANELELFDSLKTNQLQDDFYYRSYGDWISGINYWMLIPIKRNQVTGGYITIQLIDKNLNNKEAFPVIWRDERWQQYELPKDLSFGIYRNGKLTKTIGDFIEVPLKGLQYKETNEVKGKLLFPFGVGEEIIVFQVDKPSVFKIFLDAGYLLLIGLFLLIVLFSVTYILDDEAKRRIFYSARIQFLINLSFLLPLLLFSYYLLISLDESYQEKYKNEYQTKFESLREKLKEISKDSTFLDAGSVIQQLESGINYYEIYNEYGNLVYSNKPVVMGSLMPFSILNRLKSGTSYIEEVEQVGSLKFQTLYATIPGSSYFLSSPIYQSSTEIALLQGEVLNRVVLIFILLFFLVLWISWLVSNWLVKPFDMFKNSLSTTDLFSLHKKLSWHREDEVSLVVNSFNDMLDKLEESKRALEKFEREEAWREVAQQVAHEIKNPLTSMKLNLQRLQRDEKIKSDTSKSTSIEMLIEQIDLLGQIASSFSNYAKLPTANLQKLSLNDVLVRQLQFHGDQVVYEWTVRHDFVVQADEKMLMGILNNLILNAIQANVDKDKTKLEIYIQEEEAKVKLYFTDFGVGIPEEFVSKIFQPHFTTKTSGAGLGLAFVKKLIESMNGSIQLLESVQGKTTFVLTFEKARNEF